MTELLTRAIKESEDSVCECDAKYSGVDEHEYQARGCPTCSCDFKRLRKFRSALKIAVEALELIAHPADTSPREGGGWSYQRAADALAKIEDVFK